MLTWWLCPISLMVSNLDPFSIFFKGISFPTFINSRIFSQNSSTSVRIARSLSWQWTTWALKSAWQVTCSFQMTLFFNILFSKKWQLSFVVYIASNLLSSIIQIVIDSISKNYNIANHTLIKTSASQTNFSITNMGSEMLGFGAIAIQTTYLNLIHPAWSACYICTISI